MKCQKCHQETNQINYWTIGNKTQQVCGRCFTILKMKQKSPRGLIIVAEGKHLILTILLIFILIFVLILVIWIKNLSIINNE